MTTEHDSNETVEDEGTASGALERLTAALNLLEAVLRTTDAETAVHVSVCNAAALLVEDAISLAGDAENDFPSLTEYPFVQSINGARDLLAGCDNSSGMTRPACRVVMSALLQVRMILLNNEESHA